MSQENNSSNEKEMTAAAAAKLVRREIVKIDKDGKETVKSVAIKAEEVLDFKDCGSYVMVVTIDGQKFRGDKA